MTKEIIFEFASDISSLNNSSTCVTYANKIMKWLGGVNIRIEGNKLIVTMGGT